MANGEKDGDLGNDTGINLPITALTDNTAIPISPWDWAAIPDWGASYETTQTEAAIFAMTPGRNEIVCINQSLSNEFSNAVSFSASKPLHESQMNVNLTSQTTGASSSTNRSGSLCLIRRLLVANKWQNQQAHPTGPIQMSGLRQDICQIR